MSSRTGPTFAFELAAANLGNGITYDPVTGALISCPDQATADAYAKVLAAHDPSKQLSPTVTGDQWGFALKACKAVSAWRAASARASDADQIRLSLIARDTPLELDDPLLVRVAALAGFVPDADGQPTTTPAIAVPIVMACAQGMPL